MRWRGSLSVALVAVLLAACTPAVLPQSGEPLPSRGNPDVGVAYRFSPSYSIDFAIGDTWWRFVDPNPWLPDVPHGMFDNTGEPYQVPGVVLLSSSDRAVFRADVDRSVLALVRITDPVEAGCL